MYECIEFIHVFCIQGGENMEVSYMIFNPAGNITALVLGDEYNLEQKRLINSRIMEKETIVEQVGFLSLKDRKLTMAGGEFCGNATRCAALYYMKEQQAIELEINRNKIEAGINEKGEVWCEIPIQGYKIEKIEENIYKIILKGITILVVKEIENYNDLKQSAINLIKKYNIDDDAIGVMFVDKLENNIKIYPIVWVKEIDTLFFENACGSGTIAVTMLESMLENASKEYKVIQPSGDILKTNISIKNNIVKRAILKGKIETDNKIRKIII